MFDNRQSTSNRKKIMEIAPNITNKNHSRFKKLVIFSYTGFIRFLRFDTHYPNETPFNVTT
jgi:hypothetical protein